MRITGHKTIYRDGEYVAFPNLAVLSNGTVICAFRHALDRQKEFGRVTHVDPTARNVFIKSTDGGQTFSSDLHVIIDDEMSDQDPCLTILSDGRIIATYFRWQLVPQGQGPSTWGAEPFEQYGRSLHGLYDCFPVGAGYSISDNNGSTWREMTLPKMDGVPQSGGVRGNCIELENGDLLMPFYGSLNLGELSRSGLMRSQDRGETWHFLSTMAFDATCRKNYLEPNICRTESGRIIGLFRTQSDFRAPGVAFDDTYLNLHIAASDDNGQSFGAVQEISGVWMSNPVHSFKLKSGKVLLTYGYRRPPYGIRARICNSELTDIADAPEMVLRDDASCGDLGYPNAIQLANGDILVAYYITMEDGVRTIDVTYMRED